ncbi:unnamed protein product [Bathycoccus prasinos]
MIHDATDAHLDGHTFATTDTTVVLTWTETSYGEKTYTKLLNGASIGTETITLTDPNTPTVIEPQTLPSLDNTSLFHAYIYTWRQSTATHEVYDIKWNDGSDLWWSDTNGAAYYHAIAVNKATNTWEDYGPSHPFEEPVENADGTILITDGSIQNIYKFTKPTTASWISTPTTPPDTLPNVSGTTQTYEYKYRSSDVNYYYYDRWVINSGGWANAEMIWGINNKSNAIKVGKTQGDWINCADNPFTWNGTTYTLQRTGGSMKYTSDDGTSAIWTYCNSTGGNSQSGDSVKRLSSGGWEDGPGSRPNGNNSINEHNNVLFISHPNTPVEAVWGFDDPYDVSP